MFSIFRRQKKEEENLYLPSPNQILNNDIINNVIEKYIIDYKLISNIKSDLNFIINNCNNDIVNSINDEIDENVKRIIILNILLIENSSNKNDNNCNGYYFEIIKKIKKFFDLYVSEYSKVSDNIDFSNFNVKICILIFI